MLWQRFRNDDCGICLLQLLSRSSSIYCCRSCPIAPSMFNHGDMKKFLIFSFTKTTIRGISTSSYLCPFQISVRTLRSESTATAATGLSNLASQEFCHHSSIRGRLNCAAKLLHHSSSSCMPNFKWEEASLLDFIKFSIHISPQTMRRFWRVSALQPEDVLHVLKGFFGPPQEEEVVDSKEVELLWALFRWAQEKQGDAKFYHLPRSYEIMISLLLRFRMLAEAESLLYEMEVEAQGWGRGVIVSSPNIYSDMIRGYVEVRDLIKSMALYDRARARGVVPDASCYRALLSAVVETEDTQQCHKVYLDMIELGFAVGPSKNDYHILQASIFRNLCKDKRIMEAANLLRRVTCSGMEPDPTVLDMIADGYCAKQDFEDLMSFLREWKCTPSARVCNKIISSVCRYSNADEALLFMHNLEILGFKPDSETFGILISWSCRQRKLRNALMHLSELLSRSLKPDVHSYNAIISGLFMDGMWQHAKDVSLDMVEMGIRPNATTYRVLLSGYCIHRQFDEARQALKDMVNHGMASLAHSDDLTSKVFIILGIGHLGIKVKRTTDTGIQKAEFFDSLGNGLYLDTDIDQYDKTLTGILRDAMIPDFSFGVLNESQMGNFDTALKLKEEGSRYGQNISICSYSVLAEGLIKSSHHFENAINLQEELPELFIQLDHRVLNLFIQKLSKRGGIIKARVLLDTLLRRGKPIEVETFSTLITGFFYQRNQQQFVECWKLARRNGWLPGTKDYKNFVSYLCQFGMVNEVLEIFEHMSIKYPNSISAMSRSFLKELCITGFTSIGYALMKDFARWGLDLDERACECLLYRLYQEKMLTEAQELLDVMLNIHMPSSLAVQLEKCVHLKQVLLSKQKEGSSATYVLMNDLWGPGHTKKAKLLLYEVMVERLWLARHITNLMLLWHCKGNNFSEVREMLCIMLKMNIDLSMPSYRSLIRLNCMQGQLLSALRLKDLFMREDKSQPLTLYNILIFSLFQTKKCAFVESILDEMHDKNLVLDQACYNFLIDGYSKCGNISKSVEALNAMIKRNLKPSNRSFRTVISYLCSHHGINEALELSETMENWGIRHGSIVQNALLGCLLSQGKVSDAIRLLSRYKQNGLTNKIYYDPLIKKLCEHGSICKAIELLNIMLKKGNIPSETSYNVVITDLLNQKDFDQALDFLAEMQHKNLQPSMEICIALVQGLCKIGRTDDARMLLEAMIRSGQVPPDNIIYVVIERYFAEKSGRKASDLIVKMQQNGHLPDFETHWSLISNISDTKNKKDKNDKAFLSSLLNQSGFPSKGSKTRSPNTTLRYNRDLTT